MSNWKNRNEYWSDVSPRLAEHLEKSINRGALEVLEESLKFFCFYGEDLPSKIKANNKVSPKLDLFIVFAQDQLRSSPILYRNLNLAPAAIAARAAFENCVSQRFIINNSDPAKLADMYHRFKDIIKLKGHRNSPFLSPLPPAEEAKILGANPEWVDQATGKLVDRPHWTGKSGITFEQMVQQLGMKDYYSLYRTTSNFVHASPITLNLYNSPKGFGAISAEIQARRMCLLIAIFALETLIDYCKFFGVDYDAKEHHELTVHINKFV